MTDQEKSKAIERANAYRELMNSWAWKDLMKTLNIEKEKTIEQLLMGADNLQTARAFYKFLNFIESEIGYILEADK